MKRYTRFNTLRDAVGKTSTIRQAISSPSLAISSNKTLIPIRCFSTSRVCFSKPRNLLSTVPMCCNHAHGSLRSYTCNVGCPCPFPCGPCGCKSGCSCLPPPCNTPPRCIQYMTGYYYYPYGTWFCGPYHVSGTCVPVTKPGCVPCGKCCPCPCICPAGTVFNPGMGQQSSQKAAQAPPKRNSVSRLLPNVQKPQGLNARSPIPPILSSFVCDPNTSLEANMKTALHQEVCIPDIYIGPQKAQWKTFGCKRTIRHSICHKRLRQKYQCPQLEKPRFIATKEDRDVPNIRPHLFSYSSVAQYKNPFPRPYEDLV